MIMRIKTSSQNAIDRFHLSREVGEWQLVDKRMNRI